MDCKDCKEIRLSKTKHPKLFTELKKSFDYDYPDDDCKPSMRSYAAAELHKHLKKQNRNRARRNKNDSQD